MSGAEDGFDRLLRDRSAALLRTAYLLTGDRHLAEDLLQTALAKTYLRWSQLRDEAAGEAYVRKVLVSVYTRWWQRKWNGERPTEILPDTDVVDPYGEADDREYVRALLADLPRRQRAVIVLRFYEDMSEKDIAEALGMSAGTVKSTASAALTRLRAMVAAQVTDEPDGTAAALMTGRARPALRPISTTRATRPAPAAETS